MRKDPIVEAPRDLVLVGRVMGLLSGVGKQLGSEVNLFSDAYAVLDWPKMKTPTVLRPKGSPAGESGLSGDSVVPGCLPSDHPETLGFVGLGGHHLTAHRNMHAGSPPSSAHPLRVQNPLSQEPTAEFSPRRGPLASCRIAGVAARGVCVNPTNARTIPSNE